MPCIKITSSKMKTLKLTKSGKVKMTGKRKTKHQNINQDFDSIKDDIIMFAKKYWDNGGFYEDADIEELMWKIEDYARK